MALVIGGTSVSIDGNKISWTSGMACDVDGAPNAYAPLNSGLKALDDLRNAGRPGKWWGILTNNRKYDGVPLIQGSGDPYPGYYISVSAMRDASKRDDDPTSYVNAAEIPYISVPELLLQYGAHKGDFAVVTYGGKKCGAIVGDVGPNTAIGEGSFALHRMLGVDPQRALPAHHLVGIDDGVTFTVFANTRKTPRWPVDLATIAEAATWL